MPPLLTGHAAWVALATPPEGLAFAREEGRIGAAEYAAVIRASGLNRPVDDLGRIGDMLAQSNLVVTARDAAGRLAGVSRAMSDFAWATYLSDLCVDPAFQGRGLGRALVAETKRIAGPRAMLLLLSAPAPMTWYPKLGMEAVENGFIIRRD